MITIIQVVTNHLPYLDLTNAAVQAFVDSIILESQYSLQIPLGKDDADVENEATYSAQERILVGLYSTWILVNRKGVTNIYGDTTTSEQPNQSIRAVKKAAADVVEAEFEIKIPKNGENNFAQTVDAFLLGLKAKLCQQADLLGVWLPICDDCRDRDVIVPFRIIKKC